MHPLQTIALLMAVLLLGVALLATIRQGRPVLVNLLCLFAAVLTYFSSARPDTRSPDPGAVAGMLYGVLVTLAFLSLVQSSRRRRELASTAKARPAPPLEP
ncbi:hypothetical protein [Sphingomonas sp. 3-13AW]|uniref:hypothetical protein n=1 Tax=Sphingomonas sp. 3-13AW TaxID=3050450 RepID=UPI003BB4BA39